MTPEEAMDLDIPSRYPFLTYGYFANEFISAIDRALVYETVIRYPKRPFDAFGGRTISISHELENTDGLRKQVIERLFSSEYPNIYALLREDEKFLARLEKRFEGISKEIQEYVMIGEAA